MRSDRLQQIFEIITGLVAGKQGVIVGRVFEFFVFALIVRLFITETFVHWSIISNEYRPSASESHESSDCRKL